MSGKGQHLPHGHIQQCHGEYGGRDQFPLFLPQLLFRSIRGRLGDSGRFVALECGSKARLLHFGHNLFRCDLGFIIADRHHTGGEIDVAALYARQTPGDFFHRRTARCAVHAGDVISFFPHNASCSPKIPWGGIDLRDTIYPCGVFVKGEQKGIVFCLKEVRKIRKIP